VTELKTTSSANWSISQTLALSAFSLMIGICGGWILRRSLPAPPGPAASVPTAPAPAAQPVTFSSVSATPSIAELKQAADSQATALQEQLKNDPTNSALLVQLGNLYYDAKQYPTAIDYYERSLMIEPINTSVRTDLGTAYWYAGNADSAITQFNKALVTDPTKADTLFNLGIVKWQGKKDGPGAIAAWQKLLDTNPGYPNKENVLQLIAQAQGR